VGAKGKKLLPFFWRLIAFWRYLYRKKKLFDELDILKCSRRYYSQKDVIENPPIADVYIAGSDQIWNYEHISSVAFLNSIGLKNVAATCDPAILYTADFYRSHFHCAENKCPGSIFIYSFNIKFSLPMQQFLMGKKVILFIPGKNRKYLSIAQWLNNIEMAESVITNSFHGTVFAILFHKPFFALPIFFTGHPRNERVISLLKKTNLEYRLLNGNETKEEIEEILYRPVDWEQVDKILEEWRTYSANWLRDALASENVQTEA